MAFGSGCAVHAAASHTLQHISTHHLQHGIALPRLQTTLHTPALLHTHTARAHAPQAREHGSERMEVPVFSKSRKQHGFVMVSLKFTKNNPTPGVGRGGIVGGGVTWEADWEGTWECACEGASEGASEGWLGGTWQGWRVWCGDRCCCSAGGALQVAAGIQGRKEQGGRRGGAQTAWLGVQAGVLGHGCGTVAAAVLVTALLAGCKAALWPGARQHRTPASCPGRAVVLRNTVQHSGPTSTTTATAPPS